VDYLTTEISTSKQKKFSLVTFVDTPGLVDGDMKYAFDVDESILWLGQLICENLHFYDFHCCLTEVLFSSAFSSFSKMVSIMPLQDCQFQFKSVTLVIVCELNKNQAS